MLSLTVLFLLLSACILTHSQLSLRYAGMGLELWFQKMIPSLLPFMILSGIMIRMNLTEKAAMILYPLVKPIYKIRKNVCYAMLIGFLCGFPMGARVVGDLYTRQMVTKREANYLLAFCNNIGPVYFCSFALPLLNRQMVLPYLFGMYGIPLLYGFVLRYTLYRDLQNPQEKRNLHPELVSCDITHSFPPEKNSEKESNTPPPAAQTISTAQRLLAETDHSIQAAMQAILSLGGYMILYNLLNLLPHILLGHPLPLLSPLLEITGGLKLLGASLPLYSLLALSFGGLSCIAQTYNCIRDTDLSIENYVLHKLVLTALNGVFYLCWFQISPASFLR